MDRDEEIHPRSARSTLAQVLGHSVVTDQKGLVAGAAQARFEFAGKLPVVFEFRDAAGARRTGSGDVVADVDRDACGENRIKPPRRQDP